jgi:hypothetical protein
MIRNLIYAAAFMTSALPMARLVIAVDSDQWVWLTALLAYVAFAGLGPTIHVFRWQQGELRFFLKRLLVGAIAIYGAALFYLLVVKSFIAWP